MINAVVPDYYSEEARVAACFLEIFREEVLIWDNKAFGEAVFAIKDHNSEQDLVDLKLELVTIALPIPNKCLDGGKKYYIDDDNPPCFPDGSRYRAANLIIDEYAGNYFQDIMAAQKDEMHDIDKYAAIGVSKLHDLAQSNIFPPALWQTIRSSYPVQEAYSLVLPFVQAFVGITAAKVRQASMIDTLRFTRPVAVFSRSRTCSPWLPPAVKFLIERLALEISSIVVLALFRV